jgi:predicted metal-dependent hydrolase
MLLCNDSSFYIGWTYDVADRLAAHNAGKGAAYTASRLPAALVYQEQFENKIAAMQREYALKQLSRGGKLMLIGDVPEKYDGEYKLTRSARKTVAIHIDRNGEVEVRAPFNAALKDIESFVAAKSGLIAKHKQEIDTRNAVKINFHLSLGSRLRLLGKEYPLVGINEDRCGFDGNCFYLPANLADSQIKAVVIKIYKKIAIKAIREKVVKYAKIMEVYPAAVKVNSAKTRWGSCSGAGSLNFSWRLMMANEEAVDYVVIHELAHMTEPNHSARFWDVVAAVLPDYQQKKQLLKETQERLAKEDWE